ncbi:MAG: hypothetical protein MPN21_09055 [Thermoanaerobaculia bacterium]|nr:hypothetical protein [Thermoanaerobaculia bacterium]
MSLINEALRKARKEAAERDAQDRGVTYRPPRAHLPAERSWLPALAGVVLGALLAAGAFFFTMRGDASRVTGTPAAAAPGIETSSAPQPLPETAAAPETRPAAAPTPEPRPDDVREPAPADDRVPRATEARPESEQESRSLQESIASASTTSPTSASPQPPPATPEERPPQLPARTPPSQPEGAASEPAPATAQARRVQPPTQVGQVEEAIYVLEAEVDGIALRLDFIVWSPTRPFAQINGRQVSVGQTVDGFLVRAILREEVTLEGEDGTFRLRVR